MKYRNEPALYPGPVQPPSADGSHFYTSLTKMSFFFKIAQGANLGSFGFHLFSLLIAAP